MNEPKPFASLSSTLLARKGQAKPAMRPQGFHVTHDTHMPLSPVHHLDQDDLGWNDMGHEFEPAAPTEPVALRPEFDVPEMPEPPVVVEQQEMLARNYEPEPERAPVAAAVSPVQALAPAPSRSPRAAPGSHGKAAFTLRLDGERHLRLRLVCAVQHRSAQQIVTQALDEFLARQPDNASLAGKAK